MSKDTAIMSQQIKIGILGGTFNPVHSGHLYLAGKAMEKAGLTKVLFVPSNISYMKDQTDLVSAADRIAMVELAITEYPDFILSEVDIERGGNSYSHETIADIREQYPDAELYFIVGADTLFQMETWRNPQDIFDQAVILVAYRSGESAEHLQEKIHELEKDYHARILLIAVDRVDISSSEIREAVRTGQSFDEMVPEAVREYVIRHKLYL